MTYRVIAWTNGQVGVHAVAGIVAHPDLDLSGLWVHSAEKAGRDIGELCGIEPIGIAATSDAEALLASDADCICYTAISLNRAEEVFDDIERMLRAGKNVVNTSWAALVNPKAMGGGVYERLQKACAAGGTSLYTSGIEPGYCSIGMAVGALAMSSTVHSVRMFEIANAAALDHPNEILLSVFGFGTPDAKDAAILRPGFSSELWGPTVALVAEAIGLELDEIVEDHELLYLDESFEIAERAIPAGTVAGIKFEILGMVDGERRVTIEHYTKLRDQDFPEAPFDSYGGYRVLIDGEPSFKIDLQLSSPNGDHMHAAYVATAMPAVNAIPAVCEAEPGVLTYLDLLPHPTRSPSPSR